LAREADGAAGIEEIRILKPIAAATLCLAALALTACGPRSAPASATTATAAEAPGAPKKGTLQWAVAGDWRIPEEKERDAARHPAETLEFFGIRPTDTVVEVWPGGGWYTAILAPYLKQGGGKLIAAEIDPAQSAEAKRDVDAFTAAFIARPQVFGDIQLSVAGKDSKGVAPDGTADAVLTFRNIHNWMAGGYAEKMFADLYRALKPGGVLGVVEHRLPSRQDQDLMARSGYVSQAYVIQLAEAAGFKFEAESEISANPSDKADHPLGVWMLPPNMRAPAPGTPEARTYDPAAYRAIGESDRMTLRFRKPAQ
jgi:predicted methyltransferase